MDPKHRDRVAFLRIVSGKYEKGMKVRHVRIGKDVLIPQALTFLAGDREHLDVAYPGDIIGLHNHGTIKIGDTFTTGEDMQFSGIPNFAPELFRRIRLRDPLKQKQLLKGLVQLSEEGAVQVFRPLDTNDLIVGAEFQNKASANLALDGGDNLTYIAPTMVNLNLSIERYPKISFQKTREH